MVLAAVEDDIKDVTYVVCVVVSVMVVDDEDAFDV